DPPGLRGLDHDADQVVGVLVRAEHVEPHLRYQVDLVLRAPVHLNVAALPAVPARLADRHAVHAEHLQRGLHLVQLERLDHGGDELHATCLPGPCAAPSRDPALRPSVPRGRFAGGYALFPAGETAGRNVTQTFRRRAGRSADDRVDECRGLERGEGVGPFAQADQLDPYPEFPLDRHHDPAPGRAVQLGQHGPGDVHGLREHPRLAQPVLPGGGVQYEQYLIHGRLALDDALDLAKLIHQARLGVQPPGRVHDDGVHAIVDALPYRVERDARRI